jgi:3'(2'), 5'-bisphosphate nucleotidase
MNYLFLLKNICEFVPNVGKAILQFYDNPHTFNVTKKDNSTPLTEADLAAHQLLMQYLTELTPELPVLSEEGKDIPFSERQLWGYYWLIDPLDGTKEFIEGNGEFTVNIALINQHRAVLGVIYHPISGDCFYAAEGQGAYLQKNSGEVLPIHTRSQPADGIEVLISRHHTPRGFKQIEEAAIAYHFHRQGSALKFCRIAEGKADVYPRVGPTSEWDTAAGQCIVEEAGGVLLQASGEPLQYNTKAALENPPFIVFADKNADRTLWLAWLLMRLQSM